MIRKLKGCFIAVLLLLQAWPVTASAAGGDMICLTAAKQTVQPGELLTVAVEGQRLSNLYGAEIRLAYDSGKLRFKSAQRRVSGGAIYEVKPMVTEGGLVLAFTRTGRNTPGLTGDMPLYELSFEAIATGSAAVSLTSATLVDDQAASRSAALGEGVSVDIRYASSSGESTPSPVPTPTPAPGSTPSGSPGIFIVEAAAQSSAEGVKAVAELGAALDSKGTESIRVVVSAPPETVQMQVQLPVRQVLAAFGSRIQTIEIDTGLVQVMLHPGLVTHLSGSPAEGLVLAVAKADAGSLSAAVREKLNGQSILYGFSLSVGGQAIGKLGNGEITVNLPYRLKGGETPHQVVVYDLSRSSDAPAAIKNSRYNPETGMVVFKPAEHFGQYAAVYANIIFQDMADAAWAKEYVETLAAREVIRGVGDNRFDPHSRVTRAQFVTMLMEAAGRDGGAGSREAASPFRDMEDGQWYSRAIATAGELGIIQGREDGTFGPNDGISRQDMAVMLYRTAMLLRVEGVSRIEDAPSFADGEDIAGYAAEAVAAMEASGIMDGFEHKRFLPQEPSTRAQAAAVVFRFYMKL